MDFYLSYNNKEDELRLPISPSSFQLSYTTDTSIINIQQLGDVNLIGKVGLASVSISSFFPSTLYSFCTYTDFPSPNECIALIKKWQASERPIRLIITDTDVNLAMVIKTFSYGAESGTKDINFTLELVEYKFIKTEETKQITTANGTTINTTPAKRESKEVTGTTYTVVKGDTLWSIAKKLTGNGSNYKAIAQTNNIKDPNKIYIGQVLKI